MKTIIDSLKREHPNLMTNSPSGRVEVMILRNWLLKTLKLVYDSKELSKKQKFSLADDVFNLCFGEMIRQVGIG